MLVFLYFWRNTPCLTKDNFFDEKHLFWQKTPFLTKDTFFDEKHLFWRKPPFLTKATFFDEKHLFWRKTLFDKRHHFWRKIVTKKTFDERIFDERNFDEKLWRSKLLTKETFDELQLSPLLMSNPRNSSDMAFLPNTNSIYYSWWLNGLTIRWSLTQIFGKRRFFATSCNFEREKVVQRSNDEILGIIFILFTAEVDSRN